MHEFNFVMHTYVGRSVYVDCTKVTCQLLFKCFAFLSCVCKCDLISFSHHFSLMSEFHCFTSVVMDLCPNLITYKEVFWTDFVWQPSARRNEQPEVL